MDSIQTDVLIIGAGVIGLAVAERLSKGNCEIILVESQDRFGRETSSRNSEVIHAGIYYDEGSKKARFCIRGRKLLYEFCEKQNINFRKIGKLIVCDNEKESKKVEQLWEKGKNNGVDGLSRLSAAQITKREPAIRSRWAIHSAETGIFDSHQFLNALHRISEDRGVIFSFNSQAFELGRVGDRWQTVVQDSDGQLLQIDSTVVVNAAGHNAGRIAELSGIDVKKAEYRQQLCKGEYFRVAHRHRGAVNSLVYPPRLPERNGEVGYGVHLVIGLDGGIKLGPNWLYGQNTYEVDANHRQEFWRQIHRFFPVLELDDLTPEMSGIRAMRAGEEKQFLDFIVAEESARNLGGLVNLIGIHSPGLTSALAMAEEVEKLLLSAGYVKV